MHLSSNKVNVNMSQEKAYVFLSQLSNYEKLMPENIAKFEVLDNNSFVFALSGMPEIKLKLAESHPHERVILESPSEKLNFTLRAEIAPINEQYSVVQLLFDGEFNPMIGMMIKSPISKFLESLAGNLAKM